MPHCVLTINGGSSSIKFALYAVGETAHCMLTGMVDRIGLHEATVTVRGAADQPDERVPINVADHQQAVEQLIPILQRRIELADVVAVGHRVVHGGPRLIAPRIVTAEVIDELRRICPLDPLHLPGEIALIEAIARYLPGIPQVACFDTAFHQDLPRCARMLPIPRRYEEIGIRRYGFHGLSFSYLLSELGHSAGQTTAKGRVILAHLGSGASLAAVRDGKCIDTSMAFTPNAGLVMGTRCGDLDPGVLTYLMRTEHLTSDQIDELINQQSGLRGISETSSDIRDLLERQSTDVRAAEAVTLFCYQSKKWIGAFAAALGGLETLVFAGGIGENAPEIRARICEGLEFLGVRLDPDLNSHNETQISAAGSPVTVRVIPTNEEWSIVTEVQAVLSVVDRSAIRTF